MRAAGAGFWARLPVGQPGLAVALGGVGVSLQDMVQLYAAIARGGVAVGLSAEGPGAEGARVLTRASAWEVGDILAGLAPPPGAPSNRLAYKTGTSYGHRDAWAIGFDGRHVVGVWMGRADNTPVPVTVETAVQRDAQGEKLRQKYAPKEQALRNQLLRAQQKLEAEKQQASSRPGLFSRPKK